MLRNILSLAIFVIVAYCLLSNLSMQSGLFWGSAYGMLAGAFILIWQAFSKREYAPVLAVVLSILWFMICWLSMDMFRNFGVLSVDFVSSRNLVPFFGSFTVVAGTIGALGFILRRRENAREPSNA